MHTYTICTLSKLCAGSEYVRVAGARSSTLYYLGKQSIKKSSIQAQRTDGGRRSQSTVTVYQRKHLQSTVLVYQRKHLYIEKFSLLLTTLTCSAIQMVKNRTQKRPIR